MTKGIYSIALRKREGGLTNDKERRVSIRVIYHLSLFFPHGSSSSPVIPPSISPWRPRVPKLNKQSQRNPQRLVNRWSKDSNWIGFVAVSDDEETRRIGLRDIAVAWRGDGDADGVVREHAEQIAADRARRCPSGAGIPQHLHLEVPVVAVQQIQCVGAGDAGAPGLGGCIQREGRGSQPDNHRAQLGRRAGGAQRLRSGGHLPRPSDHRHILRLPQSRQHTVPGQALPGTVYHQNTRC
ncbi:unnamed protein product [Cuscuta campestris]|uniref:Uncharacterized protein n=1 Tax=Cuscuta campestris TaxID=132261 RepID=A0A484LJY9_9ASTE|nr:unnamed protein product [Cuscuta campestris]